MKLIMLFILLMTFTSACSQKNKAIFLVHSTGISLYSEGKVTDWVKTYNSDHGTSFQITARSYPNTPWPWENYPYDYWKLWVNNNCDNSNPNIECLASIANEYELVVFKHCYPGANIGPDTGNPDVSSKKKTLENYKLQYRALRSLMDGMPDKKFMIMTLVPLHRLATTPETASRANEFVTWVKNQWLTEDGKPHSNIFIFDFFSLAAEMNENPVTGQQYCLKYDYEGSHTQSDSHPNSIAYRTIGPHFAEAVVKALSKNDYATGISVGSQSGETSISTDKGTLQLTAEVLPPEAISDSVNWSVSNQTGKATINTSGLLAAEKNGTVKAIATATDGSEIYGELLVTITNQITLIDSIQITDNLPDDTIIGIGTELNLSASVFPVDATIQEIEWTVENLTGEASINHSGTLTTTAPGVIKVIARAKDGSQCSYMKEYAIVFPVSTLPHINGSNSRIFPNPTNGKFQIEVDRMPAEGITVEISNSSGQILLKKKVFDKRSEWSLVNDQGNMYFVRIIERNRVFTRKIINVKRTE